METEEQFRAWWAAQWDLERMGLPLRQLRSSASQVRLHKKWLQCVKLTRSQPEVIQLRYTLRSPSHPDEMVPHVVDALVDGNTRGGIETASESMHAYYDEVARALYDGKHPALRGNAEVEARAQDALGFNRLLKSLLGVEIEPEVGPRSRVFAKVRGRRFDPAELSDGERVLIVWAILLHRQHQWLGQSILIIDEPENHLHPDVCIRAIDALCRDVLGEHGQIFLATHSVPLLAHVGMDSIYFVDQGRIAYAGRKLDALIDKLLGGAEGRKQLHTFLGDAEQRSFYSFAAQCLLPPGVAEAREGDPQQVQFLRLMQARKKDGVPLRVLDYAAGKGRFALTLAETLREQGSSSTLLEYFAFNDHHFCETKDAAACRDAISQLHPGAEASNYFDRFEAIHVGPSPKMDVVLMCNVLHEIPVKEWPRLFQKLTEILSEEGCLLIMEDSLPPIGELPDPTGYLLLDRISAQALFYSTEGVRVVDQDKGGRLIALEIDQRVLKNVSRESVDNALKKIRDCALEESKHLRSEAVQTPAYDRGRLHAHYTMLYTNACLALGV